MLPLTRSKYHQRKLVGDSDLPANQLVTDSPITSGRVRQLLRPLGWISTIHPLPWVVFGRCRKASGPVETGATNIQHSTHQALPEPPDDELECLCRSRIFSLTLHPCRRIVRPLVSSFAVRFLLISYNRVAARPNRPMTLAQKRLGCSHARLTTLPGLKSLSHFVLSSSIH